ncbi:MAG: diacylglycerol kinase family protein [bacterium]|nr:diacylglycerol kinase family protein [bacterium]
MPKERDLLKSFSYALYGLEKVVLERNFRIQICFGVGAIVLSFVLHVPFAEKVIIVLCTGLVLAGEIMNSATERLLDFVSQERREDIRTIKDLTAAAVLIFSITSLAIGLWIFGRALL